MTSYRFNGTVVKLKQEDFDRWEKAFKNIPNLDAALLSRDVWLSEEASDEVRKKWFLTTANYLANMDRRNTNNRDGSTKFRSMP